MRHAAGAAPRRAKLSVERIGTLPRDERERTSAADGDHRNGIVQLLLFPAAAKEGPDGLPHCPRCDLVLATKEWNLALQESLEAPAWPPGSGNVVQRAGDERRQRAEESADDS